VLASVLEWRSLSSRNPASRCPDRCLSPIIGALAQPWYRAEVARGVKTQSSRMLPAVKGEKMSGQSGKFLGRPPGYLVAPLRHRRIKNRP
jgi:hypothetical protein